MTVYIQKLYWYFGQFIIADPQVLDENLWQDEDNIRYSLGEHGVYLGVEDCDIFDVDADIYFNESLVTNHPMLVQHVISVPSRQVEFSAPTIGPDFILDVSSDRVRVTAYRLENLKFLLHLEEI